MRIQRGDRGSRPPWKITSYSYMGFYWTPTPGKELDPPWKMCKKTIGPFLNCKISWGAWTPNTPPPPHWQKNSWIRARCPGTNIFGGVGLCWCCTGKKLNFDLKTPSPGSEKVGEGGRRGESQQFFRHVRASHTLLGKLALFPHRPQIPESIRIDIRIRGELYVFFSIHSLCSTIQLRNR